jgi:hypothetical protein
VGEGVADEQGTHLEPRPRWQPTLPAQPHNLPNHYECEYKRAGALNLFAAFDTRSGRVYGYCAERKRQQECLAFLEQLDREITPSMCLGIAEAAVAKHSAGERDIQTRPYPAAALLVSNSGVTPTLGLRRSPAVITLASATPIGHTAHPGRGDSKRPRG